MVKALDHGCTIDLCPGFTFTFESARLSKGEMLVDVEQTNRN